MGKSIKENIYSKLVLSNSYVKEAYELPNMLDLDYHKKHRLKDALRLSGLVIKYGIFKVKPSSREQIKLESLREKLAPPKVKEIFITKPQKNDTKKDIPKVSHMIFQNPMVFLENQYQNYQKN